MAASAAAITSRETPVVGVPSAQMTGVVTVVVCLCNSKGRVLR
jgi:hypothetical protein